jgi:glycosyltransferase involved in cell wall biosynthesis/Flp pilus assembly protein TadD
MPVRDRLKRAYYKATLLFNRARHQAQPNDPGTLLKMAAAHVERQEWPQAIACVEQVLQADPHESHALRILAQAHLGKGNRTAALTAIQTSLSLDGNAGWSHHVLGQIHLANQDYAAAIAAIAQGIAIDPNVSWLHFNLGEAYLLAGDWAKAVTVLQTSIRLNPIFPWAHYYLGNAQLALGNFAAAQQAYQKAQLFGPDVEHVRGNAAYVDHLQAQGAEIDTYIQQTHAQDTLGLRSRPRVLLILPGPAYPPRTGGAVRSFYEMKALHGKVDLVVASLLYDKATWRVKDDLANYAQLALVVDTGERPPRDPDHPKSIHRYRSPGFETILKQLGSVNFDIVVSDFMFMAQYRDYFPKAFHVLSEHNIESQIVRRSGTVARDQADRDQADQQAALEILQEADHLAAFEDRMWPQYPLRFVVSEQDRQMLTARCPIGETVVVNNGANTREIKLLPDNPLPRVLLIGTLNYLPNVDGAVYFASQILPHVWRLNPKVEFWIAGADPVPEVRRLAEHDRRIKLIANPEVMEDVAAQCCLSVVPLRIGSGTRIKILQSLAMGLPTVTTTLGCEGLLVEDDKHLLIRDRPEDFAKAIVELIADANQRDRLRQTGRALVEAEYDWEQIWETAVDLMLDRYAKHKGDRQK